MTAAKRSNTAATHGGLPIAAAGAADLIDPSAVPPSGKPETQERRARRLIDEMARNIGREAVNHLKRMHPDHLTDRALRSKSWEQSMVNTIRNDINRRMRPLLMAMIAMHKEWEEEH